MKQRRCFYCGRKFDGQMRFCSADCREKYGKAEKHDQPYIKYFVIGIVLGIGVMFFGVCALKQWLTGAGIMVTGLTITLLPFTTPDTVELMGYKRARTAGRIAGAVTMLVGLAMCFL